jgi:hypothetical protein
MNKTCYIPAKEHYTVIKIKGIKYCFDMGDLENITLRQRNQSQNSTNHMISFI